MIKWKCNVNKQKEKEKKMAISKTILEISMVTAEVKKQWNNTPGVITRQDCDKMVDQAICSVAQQLGITDNTIRSKCIRDMGMDMRTFKDYVFEALQGKPDQLVDWVVEYRKPTVDDETTVRNIMSHSV